ncbi:hypothetical protein BS50DRAFT_649155 [Corynespora cassiicola Philippines]|uniref:Galactose oxidase n=1 Tax=Corynespora cassiicola Philippines TaxID=1448308 RepID=A0A2T2NDI1_CORCC|nr:hypothetical protein BS50DRAFT_649155 [Corynespora cassiicola Philippines]
MVKLDMSTSWSWLEDNVNMTFISLQPTNYSSQPFIGGSLFGSSSNTSSLYLFGGGPAASNLPNESMDSQQIRENIWSFSLTNNKWSRSELTNGPEYVPRHGAYVEAKNRAFYLHGILGNDPNIYPNPNMTVIDIVNKSIRSVSTAQLSTSESRSGAVLQFIPELGEDGALILLGGELKSLGNPVSNELNKMASLETVHILDIASLENGEGVWYQQKTSGRTPPGRADFCAATISSPDKTNFHIYVFAGRSNTQTFDDLWVLSLPQFHWTKNWIMSYDFKVYNGAKPNFGSTCHLVGSKQMLVLGGMETRLSGSCTKTKAAFFDLTNLKWTQAFVKDGPPYRVPKAVWEWINGTLICLLSAFGEAYMTGPKEGFSSEGLTKMFADIPIARQRNSAIAFLGYTSRSRMVTAMLVAIFLDIWV